MQPTPKRPRTELLLAAHAAFNSGLSGFDAVRSLVDRFRVSEPEAESAAGLALNQRDRAARTMTTVVKAQGADEYTNASYARGRKRTRQSEISRVTAANLCDVRFNWKGLGRPFQYGFYSMGKFRFTDGGENFHAMPCYAFDLTATPNIGVGGSIHNLNPMLRMYINRTTGRVQWRPALCQAVNGGLGTATVPGKGNSSVDVPSLGYVPINHESLANANNIYPYARDYIKVIDIYMNLFGARKYPTRWKIDVNSFPDWACPHNNIDSTSDVYDAVCADEDMHDAYWINEMVTWTNHPLNVQRGTRNGGQPALLYRDGAFGVYSGTPRSHCGGPKFITQDPKDFDISEPNTASSRLTQARMHRQKISLYLDREVNLQYRQTRRYDTDNNVLGLTVNGPTSANADTMVRLADNYVCTPKPEQRLYLMVYCTDFEDMDILADGNNAPTGGLLVGGGNAWGTRIATQVDPNNATAEIPTGNAQNKIDSTGTFDLNIMKLCRRLN